MQTGTNRREFLKLSGMTTLASLAAGAFSCKTHRQSFPNIILIYADDLGFGDLSCYGAQALQTPSTDRLASQGLRFTNAHSTSATCTPSRYSLLTGEYAWRRKDTGIARGNAAALIQPGRETLPAALQKVGYATGVVGKWHLGLGPASGANWNGEISHGPLDIGFDYAFLIPATGDRVPCVYVENRRVAGLDPADPIQVSYDEPILDEPTGKDHPEMLKMHPSHGHDHTIINGVSRIGYMSGGKSARWVDEDMADTITEKAIHFIERHQERPFFLYFSTHDIHVPRVPHPRFAGKSGMGGRGDAILQFDWCVGELLRTCDKLNLTNRTLVMLTSDNGPVVDDGYHDQSVELLGHHKPAGPLRGGKYSAFDGGTRIPFIVRWPERIPAGLSDALWSQIDLFASLAALVGHQAPAETAPDTGTDHVLLGVSAEGRDHVIEHAAAGTLAIIQDDWKYIEPNNGPQSSRDTNIELGNDPEPQLYNLSNDLGETTNLAATYPDKVNDLANLLQSIKEKSRARF